jgi:multicomponent Na+:H+ antiporter subunit F
VTAIWLAGAAVLVLALVPCAVVCFTDLDPVNRLVGLEMGGVVLSLALVLLAIGIDRVAFLDVAVLLALLSFGGGLVFARFLERWL